MSVEHPEDRAGFHDLGGGPPRAEGGLGNLGGGHPKAMMGSLAQSARDKQIRVARNILIVIGILQIVFNAALLATMRDRFHRELEEAVNKQLGPGMVVNREKLQEIEDMAVRAGTVEAWILIATGASFVVLGLLTRKYPVPTTILGLVLYLAGTAYFFVSLAQAGAEGNRFMGGLWLRVVIVVLLIKAIQSALAYQREERAARAAGALAAEPLA